MEQVLQGWLVKSPPEKKSFGTWKIFGAVNFRFELELDASVNPRHPGDFTAFTEFTDASMPSQTILA